MFVICKVVVVFGMDKVVVEFVSCLLESMFRSSYLFSRVGVLYGIFYVLECDLLDDIVK